MKRKVGRPLRLLPPATGGQIISGTRSPKTILAFSSEVERRIYKQIYALEPYLTATDRILVQLLAKHLARLGLYESAFRKNGILDKDGRSTEAERVYFTCSKNIIKICDSLALSTITKHKLGILAGQFQKMKRDFRKEYKAETKEDD